MEMETIEDFNNLFLPHEEEENMDYRIPYISFFSLNYTESDIMINAFCLNNHTLKVSLKEFLIKFHPLYDKCKNYEFCNKCMLKFFYCEKSTLSFHINYCDLCDKLFCYHSKNHIHELKIIEKEYPFIEDFVFPICPVCEIKKNPNFLLNDYKFTKKYFKDINESLLKSKKMIEKIEEDFNKIEGRKYISLFPYFEYYMKNNYLEIILSENLLKTYLTFKKKKVMYNQVIKNIENNLIFGNIINLSKIKEYKIESLIHHFNNINNCFLKESNKKLIKKDFDKFLIKLNIDSNLTWKKIYSFENTVFFIPELKKIFHLNPINDSLNIYDFDLSHKPIIIFLNENPINIIYMKKNLFFFQYSNKLVLYSFHEYNDFTAEFIEKQIFNDDKIIKNIYSQILTTKNKIFIFFASNTLYFYSFNSKTKNLIFMKEKDSIMFIKRLKNNLFIISQNNNLSFLNEDLKEIGGINLGIDRCENEQQICDYKQNYLILISSNFNPNVFLIDVITFSIKKKINLYSNLLNIIKINEENIENDNSILYLGNFSKIKNYNKNNSPIIIENNDKIIISDNSKFYFIKDIEKDNTLIIDIKVNSNFLDQKNFSLNNIFVSNNNSYIGTKLKKKKIILYSLTLES